MPIPREPSLVVRRGEHLTCENRHVIATAVRDVYDDQWPAPRSADFADWVGDDEPTGRRFTECECRECGGDYVRVEGGRVRMCVEGEWRLP